MKNYSSWSTEQLREEERELRLMGHNEAPDICKMDRIDNLQGIRRMQQGHADWLAVCNELKSRQNRET